ncbi:MAG TPA: TadE/TadG family type IV pilus assembly protein [Streptosporangiaceae bacterium]|nr:TadE/TadG family type IV pilus assembly protein [Streptosporangiaceae bacterium]
MTTCRAAARKDRPITRDDRGALTLSYVIIMPVFLLALMLIVQASVYYLAREAALAAARQGADIARVRGASTTAGTSAALRFVRSAASGYLLSPSASAQGSTARTVVITVSGRVPAIFPGLGIDLSQSARVPVEKFTIP